MQPLVVIGTSPPLPPTPFAYRCPLAVCSPIPVFQGLYFHGFSLLPLRSFRNFSFPMFFGISITLPSIRRAFTTSGCNELSFPLPKGESPSKALPIGGLSVLSA